MSVISVFSLESAACPLLSAAGSVFGDWIERMAEAGVARRDGGRGKESARLKVWITFCS